MMFMYWYSTPVYGLGLAQHEQVTKAALAQYQVCQTAFPKQLENLQYDAAMIMASYNLGVRLQPRQIESQGATTVALPVQWLWFVI